MRALLGQVVLDSNGEAIPVAYLPPPSKVRWVASRKAAVLAAVHEGFINVTEACRRYSLSPEEFQSWERQFQEKGLAGLQARARPPLRDRLSRMSITAKICAAIRSTKQRYPKIRVSDFQLRAYGSGVVLINLKTGEEELIEVDENEGDSQPVTPARSDMELAALAMRSGLGSP